MKSCLLALAIILILAAPAPAPGQSPVETARAMLKQYQEDPSRIDRARDLLEAAVAQGGGNDVPTLLALTRAWFLYAEERARAARMDRLAALTELSLTRELARSTAPAYPLYANPFYGTPVVVIPGFWVPPGKGRHHHKPDSSKFTHVPGSLIGGNLFPPSSGH